MDTFGFQTFKGARAGLFPLFQSLHEPQNRDIGVIGHAASMNTDWTDKKATLPVLITRPIRVGLWTLKRSREVSTSLGAYHSELEEDSREFDIYPFNIF